MIWTKTNAYQVICRPKNAAILNGRLVQNNTFMKNWLLNLINKRNNGKDFLIFYCLTKNNDKICSRFQAISILLAKRTRLSRQNFFCRSQDKIFVFRTGCDVKFSGRIGKKMSASLGPPEGPPWLQQTNYYKPPLFITFTPTPPSSFWLIEHLESGH